MSDEALTKVLAGLRAQPYRGRSELYRWLRANHRRLARRLAKDQTSWAVIAQELAAAGLKNTKGDPPSSDSVRRVWATVCRDVAEEMASKARQARKKPPSRISPDWRPQVVPQPSAAPVTPTARVLTTDGTRPEAAQVGGRPGDEPMDFPTIGPSGAPLAEGHVLYRGRPMLRRVAEQLAKIDRQAREMDRFK